MLIIKNPPPAPGRVNSCHASCSFSLLEVVQSLHAVCSIFFLLFAILLSTGCTPSGPRSLLKGKHLIEEGKYKQALDQLKIATSLLSTNAQAWNYLGLAYHYAGVQAEAEKAYQRALLYNRDLAEAHFNLGCLWLEQNKTNAAKNELMAFVLHRPNSVEGLLRLGVVQLRSHETAAAEKSLIEALRLAPQNAEALNDLGIVRLQQRRSVEASQQFNNALRVQPEFPAALLNLAIVSHQYSKDRPVALQKYRQYLALKPPPENSEGVKAIVHQLEVELAPPPHQIITNPPLPTNVPSASNPTNPRPGKAASASGFAPVVAVTTPPAYTPRTSAVQTTELSTNPAKSAPPTPPPANPPVEVVKLQPDPVFQPAQDISPPTNRVSQSESFTSNAAPRPSPAAQTAEPKPKRSLVQRINPLNLFRSDPKPATRTTPLPTASSTSPPEAIVTSAPDQSSGPPITDAPIARYIYISPAKPASGNHAEAERSFTQALHAQQLQHVQEALQAYRMATKLDPAYYEAYYNLGLAAAAAGESSAALAAYENALAIRPESLDARYNFALVLKQANYPLDSVHELEKLLNSYPNETRAHLALGNLYAQVLHQPANARQHYLKVIETDPKHPQASAIRNWLSTNPQ
jgi:tetratricopeptide (TPR) repeat protein